MIPQLRRQLNNLDRSKTIACSASFCFGLSLRCPCPLPKRISSRILSKSMFIPQNHPKSQQRLRTCAVIEKPVFRASLALSMHEIELYQICLPYDGGRFGYEINSFPQSNFLLSNPFLLLLFSFDVFLHQVVNGCLLERYSTIRFVMFLSVSSSSTLFQPTIAALYLTTATAQELMAIIKLRLLIMSLNFNNIFSVFIYDSLTDSIICSSRIEPSSRTPRYLYSVTSGLWTPLMAD